MQRKKLIIEVPDIEQVDVAEASLVEVRSEHGSWSYAFGDDRSIYLSGDIHPRGAQAALAEALDEGIEYVQHGAVEAYFPIRWIQRKCEGVCADRYIAIENIERFIRSHA